MPCTRTRRDRRHNFMSLRRATPCLSLLAAALWGAALHVPAAVAGDVCSHADGTDSSSATGDGAFACGYDNVASAEPSAAVGFTNNATGYESSAFGIRNNAGSRGSAIGRRNDAIGDASSAIGSSNRAAGFFSSAVGNSNDASGDYSSAVGSFNDAIGLYSNAVGHMTSASGTYSSAFGARADAVGQGSLALGGWYDRDNDGFFDQELENATATGTSAVAVGAGVQALGDSSSAIGVGNLAEGAEHSAIGYRNTATGYRNSVVGAWNTASGAFSSAMGSGNTASGENSAAFGQANLASGDLAGAFGRQNQASGTSSFAFGHLGIASGANSVTIGALNTASGAWSGAFGLSSVASGERALVLGAWFDRDADGMLPRDGTETALASGTSSVALGAGVNASGHYSAALGVNATANADYSVAIGYSAVADREYTISVGSAARRNQIANLAAGTEDFDAVNLRQMRAADDDLGAGVAAWLGGGAAYAGGALTAPVYVIQSNNYGNVGAAFGAVDAALTDINQRIVDTGGIQGERGYSAYEVAVQNGFAGTEADWLGSLQGPAGPGGPQGPEGPAGGGPRSVVYDDDGRDVLTLAGDNGTTIANVADGVATTDATNVRQMQAGDTATLASANSYTDTVAVQTLQSANEYTDSRFAAWDAQLDSIQRGIDDRFHEQDRRIDRQGAMGSAMLNMAINAAGSQSPRGRIAVGAGFQGGEQAVSVGYGRKVGERASFSLGGAFSGGEKSAGVGFGVDL